MPLAHSAGSAYDTVVGDWDTGLWFPPENRRLNKVSANEPVSYIRRKQHSSIMGVRPEKRGEHPFPFRQVKKPIIISFRLGPIL